MRLLLDTHAFLWWMEASSALSTPARNAIANPRNEVLISIASLWELTIKQALGKLTFPADPETVVRNEGFSVLPVGFTHLRRLGTLPHLHRDPFDRMLVAQAMVEGAALVSQDSKLTPYGTQIIW